MTFNSLTFENASKKIVSEFLHSVVIVDDRASLDIEVLKAPSINSSLVVPGRIKKNISAKGPMPTMAGVPLNNSSDLNAKLLIDTFADNGLVCAVLKPIEHESGLDEKTDHATHKSDIVILDWQIGDNEEKAGSIALSLISKIISTDSKDRLRLIAIYTSSPDLALIAEQIKDVISIEGESAIINNFEILRGPIKVVIYQKFGGNTVIDKSRVAKEYELPEKLINDFTNLTRGLLSNVALKSLGTLRENTHRILNKFNSDIDASYITHRILNNPPEEAENHPVPLIASELLDVLEDCKIKTLVSNDFIVKWLDYQINLGLNFAGKFTDVSHEQTLELIKQLLKNGVENEETYSTTIGPWNKKLKTFSKSSNDAQSYLTSLFSMSETRNVTNLDMDFAILTTIRSKYSHPDPLLTLGSIVAEDITNGTNYYFCIQPLCDSVRLESARKFSFIPLQPPTKEKFHLVVKDKGAYVKLLIDFKPYNTLMLEFNPAQKGEIIAIKEKQDWIFETSDTTRKLRWVADLKFPNAQRIVTQYSEQLGRVGLTESDWLRRMAR